MTSRRLLAAAVLAAGLLLSAASPAQAPVTPMTPSEAHEQLAFFIGRWTIVEMPPEHDFAEVCDWLGSGRRHIVCHSSWQTTSGPREGLSIFSYRQSDATYVYQGFRPGGGVQTLHGRVAADGSGFEFWGEEGAGVDRTRTRVYITTLEDGRFRFVARTASGDSEEWSEEIVHYERPGADNRPVASP